ncbi:MAG: spirocyclase AveC family protein [Acidimicrobiia bacterium]|nr:spirocyclase AveC family protein [Acidimicrobiia bacterium]
MVVVLARWLAHGVTSVDPGPDPFPTGKLVLIRVLEWGQLAALVALVWFHVGRRLVRGQRLAFDGLFILAVLLLNFWDPLDNYLVFSFQYNAHFLNVGSWGGEIPGWQSPNGHRWVVPVAFVFGAYVWAFFVAARMGCAILDKLRSRYPQWSAGRRFLPVFAANALLAAVAEITFLRSGAIANIRPAPHLTAGQGQFTQWPLYNPLLFGAAFTAATALRWSVDERGHSFVERGAEQLRMGPRLQTIIRFLAVSAYMQVSYITLYFLPWNLLSLAHGPAPELPSYFPT